MPAICQSCRLSPKPYTLHLEGQGDLVTMEKKMETTILLRVQGQGDLVTRLISMIIWVTIWVIGVTNLLTKSP